nr:AraC family transcriptional regulator [uncultured Capnocytophaga sp.]
MKRLTKQDIQELSLEQVEVPLVKSEAEMEIYCGRLEDKLATFTTHGKKIGKHAYYSWQAEVRDNYSFEGRMAIPSVRFYFVTKSQKGIHVDIDGQIFTAKQGEHNVFFCKDECFGRDIFLKNDTMEVITIAISEEEFAQIAQQYPDSFMAIYKRYQSEDNFLLSCQGGFLTSMQMQTVLQQLNNTELLGNAAGVYADLKVLELFLLQFHQMDTQKYQNYQYCKTHMDIDKIYEVSERLIHNLRYTPSISELAREIGMNEKKLCYGFKEVFGNTIFGYLYDYKMQLAQQLLLHTDKPISEIAYQCGYEHLSHFSTAFKRKFGLSPQEMRR